MNFEKEYKKLNPAQKEAVDTLNGPVMVIAGPGTGKTQILTMRIANILKKTDADPNSILALTFTESGVKAMKQRLVSLIGEQAYYVNINTFHSFANQVIVENPEVFLLNNQFSVLSDLERLSTIHNILDESTLELLKPANAPYFYANHISRNISNLKREGVTYERYKNLVSKNKQLVKNIQSKDKKTAKDLKEIKDLNKQLEFKKIYKSYQEKITELNRYDFEDLINQVIEKFSQDELLLKSYQEKFQYILVDEFQDTNNAQYEILNQLTSFWEEPDIFAVGDDDQSIYRFQGASVENMLRFINEYKTATVINLTANYRSTQKILDSSRKVISNNKQSIQNTFSQIDKNLNSQTKRENNNLQLYEFSNGILETYFISTKIKKLIEQGEDPTDIAVIYRNNRDAKDLEKALSVLNVRYNLEGGGNILVDEHVKMFLKLLTTIENIKTKNEDIDLFTLLNYNFLDFDYVDNLKIARFASSRRVNFFEAIQHKDFVKGKVLENHQDYTDFVLSKLSHWANVDSNNTFTKTFEVILNESGFLDYVLKQKNYEEILNKVNTLYESVQSQVKSNNNLNLSRFLTNINTLNENYLKISEQDLDIKANVITLTTAHKSKGLEFKHVFIYKCVDKKWGNTRNIEYIPLPKGIVQNQSKDNIEEERRLFYVALTRAKQNIYISYSNEYSSSWGNSNTDKSVFILELAHKMLKIHTPRQLEDRELVKNAQQTILTKSTSTKISAEESVLLKEVIDKYKLSVTGLNTYLECPYKFKLNALLRTPRAKAPYLALGTAVHKALEEYYKVLINTDEKETLEFLINEFQKALNKEILTKSDYKTQLKKGTKILNSYYKAYSDELKKPEYLERLFGYGFSRIYVNDIPLVGKIDRVDLIKNQGVEKQVRVVDYKTGKVKSQNDIEGKTKYSKGHEKRQLVFYKILCDLDKTFRMKAKVFELDYVGDGKTETKPKKRAFEISEQEVRELKKLIVDTMKKIRSMNFPKTNDYSNCTFCDYKDHCWPQGIPDKAPIQQGNLSL